MPLENFNYKTNFALDDEGTSLETSSEGPETKPVDTMTSEEILDRFPTCPVEIRNMIYAAMVNHPRLLHFTISNDLYEAHTIMQHPDRFPGLTTMLRSNAVLKHAELPSSMFLNKEANAEITRHINLVPEAKNNNPLPYPWSYINPGYDVLYSACGSDVPIAKQAPGIQFLALGEHDDGFWNTEFNGNNHDFFADKWFTRRCKRLLSKIRGLPNLKELLVVRNTTRILGDFAKNPCKLDIDLEDPVFRIKRHPCGFFGLLNDEIEKRYPKLKPRNSDYFDSYLSSQRLIDAYIARLTTVNEEMHPGTKLPKLTGVYSQWVDERGIWKSIHEM